MSVWSSIGGAVCVALSGIGLVLSVLVWRRKGAGRGMRAAAWSLIPLVAYLTGAVLLVGRLVNAVVRFGGSFVFSPKSWAGVIVLGLAVVLFLASGGIPLLRRGRRKRQRDGQRGREPGAAAGRTRPAAVEPRREAPGQHPAAEDDMREVEEILRQRGIK